MSKLPQDWSLEGLSIELGRSRQWVAKLIANTRLEPVRTKGRSKYWRMADVVRAIVGRAQEYDLTVERARLAARQAQKLELEIARIEGELVPVEMAREALELQISTAKGKMLAMASRLSQRIASITGGDRDEIEQLIADEVRDTLTEMAEHGIAGKRDVPKAKQHKRSGRKRGRAVATTS